MHLIFPYKYAIAFLLASCPALTLGAPTWATGRSCSGRLGSGRLDAWTLDYRTDVPLFC